MTKYIYGIFTIFILLIIAIPGISQVPGREVFSVWLRNIDCPNATFTVRTERARIGSCFIFGPGGKRRFTQFPIPIGTRAVWVADLLGEFSGDCVSQRPTRGSRSNFGDMGSPLGLTCQGRHREVRSCQYKVGISLQVNRGITFVAPENKGTEVGFEARRVGGVCTLKKVR